MELTNSNNSVLESVDARTKLAGSNKMEILLFSLGTKEIFGINVFKVREVSRTPNITRCPNMPDGVAGVISLRGNIIPVINLAQFTRLQGTPEQTGGTMIVTEYSRHTQGFLVHEVDHIVRVDWEKVRAPENMLAGQDGLITAITELDDSRLVSILDVEQVLAGAYGEDPVGEIAPLGAEKDHIGFFVDDSTVARKLIAGVLDKLGVEYQQANNGAEAWTKLEAMANRIHNNGERVIDHLDFILVDAEMPEMDGYVLTRHIKQDFRFEGIPVIMHSSLSSEANRSMGKAVGVDAYVAKFDPEVLAETLRAALKH